MSPGFTMIDNDAVIERLPEIDGSAIKVFLALARRADRDGRCWPSQSTIGKDSGLRPRAVRSALVRLRSLGLLRSEAQSGHATIYCITPAPPCRPESEGEAPPCRTPRHDDAGDPGTAVPTTPAPPCLQNKNHRTIPKNNTQGTKPKARGLAAAGVDVATASWMFGLIQKLDPGAKVPNLDKWANDVRLMRESDGRTDEDIRAVFGWANADTFWGSNILSPGKLRKQFQQLKLKMKTQANGNGKPKRGFPLGPGQRHGTDSEKVGVF